MLIALFQFDKMVGGLGSSKSKSRGTPGKPPKRTSLGDLNKAEEEGCSIGQMSDRDIMEEFEKMLENMNLSEEEKEPLRMLPISKKKDMLIMNSKTMARNKFDSPADYIQYLSNPELSLAKK
jgi:diaphanous 2